MTQKGASTAVRLSPQRLVLLAGCTGSPFRRAASNPPGSHTTQCLALLVGQPCSSEHRHPRWPQTYRRGSHSAFALKSNTSCGHLWNVRHTSNWFIRKQVRFCIRETIKTTADRLGSIASRSLASTSSLASARNCHGTPCKHDRTSRTNMQKDLPILESSENPKKQS